MAEALLVDQHIHAVPVVQLAGAVAVVPRLLAEVLVVAEDAVEAERAVGVVDLRALTEALVARAQVEGGPLVTLHVRGEVCRLARQSQLNPNLSSGKFRQTRHAKN